MKDEKWIPEIMYEDSAEGLTSGFPFIDVPEGRNMPSCLFICESRKVDEEDNDIEKELIFHSYANMTVLKQNMTVEDFDKVRLVLGLQSLKNAEKKGKEITFNVNKNINN